MLIFSSICIYLGFGFLCFVDLNSILVSMDWSIVLLITLWASGVKARISGIYSGGGWQNAHATFYGGANASSTMGTSYPSSFLSVGILTTNLVLHS